MQIFIIQEQTIKGYQHRTSTQVIHLISVTFKCKKRRINDFSGLLHAFSGFSTSLPALLQRHYVKYDFK